MADPAAFAAAIARFAQAIDECNAGWRERWQRPPTAHELVHPFRICLGAAADELVRDPEVAEAL